MAPRVFISYAWSSESHREQILEWANRLVTDGVDVILDQWDLLEGNNTIAFMERMVTDPEVTHVLVFSDQIYSQKADARTAGVGTESTIISAEVYGNTTQSKFIPLVCEFDANAKPYLPKFFGTTLFMNFSSPEQANANWERLIRLLHGKPQLRKPALGKPPSYISDDSPAPASIISPRFQALKYALEKNTRDIPVRREEFLESCYEEADALRVRAEPDPNEWSQQIVSLTGKLVQIRDALIDWVMLESRLQAGEAFSDAVLKMLERLVELKSRPADVSNYEKRWFFAHRFFAYETFLYTVAALLKTGADVALRLVFGHHFHLPETESDAALKFKRFHTFLIYADSFQLPYPDGRNYISSIGELLKRQTNRTDVPFSDIIQADLLTLVMAFLRPDTHWYPHTLHYASLAKGFPFFKLTSRHRDFERLLTITQAPNVDELRRLAREGSERLGVSRWNDFWLSQGSFLDWANIKDWDTLS